MKIKIKIVQTNHEKITEAGIKIDLSIKFIHSFYQYY